MKILYTSDTHVYPAHLDRLLKAAATLQPAAVIIGGDINPNWKGSIGDSIESHKLWLKERLLPRIGKFRQEHSTIPVLLDLGNDDIAAARFLLEEKDGKELHLLHMRVAKIGEGLAVAGYMKVNPTPFGIKDNEKPDCKDRDGLSDPGVKRSGSVTVSGVEEPYKLELSGGFIEDDLLELSAVLESAEWKDCSFLFVSHAPPRDTSLDLTGTGLHVGSLAVRRFIERWSATGRLIASFHGHIHESPMKSGRLWQHVGNAPSFNVGQTAERLRALLFDLDSPLEGSRLVLAQSSGEVSLSAL